MMICILPRNPGSWAASGPTRLSLWARRARAVTKAVGAACSTQRRIRARFQGGPSATRETTVGFRLYQLSKVEEPHRAGPAGRKDDVGVRRHCEVPEVAGLVYLECHHDRFRTGVTYSKSVTADVRETYCALVDTYRHPTCKQIASASGEIS